ncbi:hypothetical protein PIB30_053698 [Stylosanthes scabra]|uniref:Protein kinase domain-containing protein n=1 Tax=Stylosanthes scabra TaxID=79078 RepID=A0ABU6YJS1_9FABA|nr:hypothetical protein [Stylosanthes scabra]
MMGFSRGIFTDRNHQDSHLKNLKVRTFLRKLIWDFAFACVASPSCTCSSSGKTHGEGFKNITLDHKKALLLAESNGVGEELVNNEPQSVHSSFRFSFRSQLELESFNMTSSSAAAAKAALLVVNLEFESLKWKTMDPLEKTISPVANTLIRFNYHEIVHATRNFSKGRVLGRGALSCVFRGKVGILRTSVAIKRLDKEDKECSKAFSRELMIASSLHNTNIVPLLGFCIDSEEGLFLVYKFVSGGSLDHHLHGRKRTSGSPLSWSVRFKVAIGIAKAIAYLHYGTERCVVHRDIKPSNILLSSKKIPKLCDFGLATWIVAPSVPFLCKAAKGTFGYLAPEYFQHGKVSDKTDVYAFGVVLLELITGRKPIESKRTQGEENLVSWAKPLLQKGKLAIEKLLDPQLCHSSSRFSSQIARMIEAAAACITYEESRRPGIYEILAILKGEQEPVLSRRRKSGYYTQLQQSNSDLNSHLALAMMGVSEIDDDDYLYCR